MLALKNFMDDVFLSTTREINRLAIFFDKRLIFSRKGWPFSAHCGPEDKSQWTAAEYVLNLHVRNRVHEIDM